MDTPRIDLESVAFGEATAADVADVVALVQSAYRGDTSRRGWTTEADFLEGQRVDAAMVASIIDQPDALVLTARLDGPLIGCCELRRLDGSGSAATEAPTAAARAGQSTASNAYLGMFAVDPRVQAGGLGRRVLDRAEQTCIRRWGARHLTITVISVRSELIAWYERRGFVPTGGGARFPYGDERFGTPLRDDLAFVELSKDLTTPGERD